MRLSRDCDDPGFHRHPEQFGVTLNGNPVIGFVTADEELNIVRFVQPNGNGGMAERVLFGEVKIERVN